MVVPDKFFDVEFGKAMAFGYRTEDVDEFVTKAIEIIKALQEENKELTEKMGVLAQSLEKYREDEESLRSALIGAQKLGDSILKDSRSKAEVILRDATTEADHIIEEAHARLDRETAEYERLKEEVAAFREGLFDMYKAHIEEISRLPHKEKKAAGKPAAQKQAQTAPPPPPPAEPEPPVSEAQVKKPAPEPPPPQKKAAPPPEPLPVLTVEEEPKLEYETVEPEEYTAPVPPPPPKKAPSRRPALRLELEEDEEDDGFDDEEEDDDMILARFSRTGRRSTRREPEPAYEDEEDDDYEEDLPPARPVFSSKFGEMRFGEGFSVTQDERKGTGGSRERKRR